MRRNEAGSVLVYIIGAVLLVSVAIGAIYFAHYRGMVAPAASTPDIAKQDDKSDKPAEVNKPSEAPVNDDEQAAADKKASDAAKAKVEAEKKQAESKSTQEVGARDAQVGPASEAPSQQGSTPMQRQPAGANDLPETGPAQDALAIVISLVALSGAGYAYYHFVRK